MALDISWVKRLESDQSKQEVITWLHNSPQVKLLLEILDELEDTTARQDRSQTQYNTPAWAYNQAHRNGNLEMINRFRAILKP